MLNGHLSPYLFTSFSHLTGLKNILCYSPWEELMWTIFLCIKFVFLNLGRDLKALFLLFSCSDPKNMVTYFPRIFGAVPLTYFNMDFLSLKSFLSVVRPVLFFSSSFPLVWSSRMSAPCALRMYRAWVSCTHWLFF